MDVKIIKAFKIRMGWKGAHGRAPGPPGGALGVSYAICLRYNQKTA
jgi:hypothetical protein